MEECGKNFKAKFLVDKAIQEWKAYQKLCGKEGILDETDYQKILVKEKGDI